MNHKLAIAPRQSKNVLHVGGPNVGDRKVFDQFVDEIFERRWFTNGGEVVQEFEARLCEYLDVKHCIPVCNATIGLQLACHALDLTGEIILPAFTFVATPHAVAWERLTPVFADIDLNTHTICPNSVESVINERTSAIIGVHLWGNPCSTELLQEIANDHQLNLIFDSAHAFGCSRGGEMVGNFGDCEVFSFHATKFFNTFEGGAIATNNDELAKKIRLMKNFGFAGMDKVIHLGTNAKMPEICAAMGMSMFGCIDQIKAKNRTNYELYKTLLEGTAGIKLFSLDHVEQTNWQYIVIEVDEHEFGTSRDGLVERLHRNNIRARRYFYPGCHNMEPYRSTFNESGRTLRNTDTVCQRVICLPTGNAVETADVIEICNTIRRG